VVYDIKLSGRLREAIEAAGGRAAMERSGHAFIRRRMLAEQALFGCEASGHYFFRELEGGDDGLFAALAVLELDGLSARVAELPEMFLTPETRIPASRMSFEEIARRLAEALTVLETETLDGVRLRLPEGVVLARPSVTEAATTLRLEGYSGSLLEGLRVRCREALGLGGL
jgi:phosphomannomutase